MNKKLVIIGASGHGKVVADIAEHLHKYEEIFFLDDNDSLDEYREDLVIGKDDRVKGYVNGTFSSWNRKFM